MTEQDLDPALDPDLDRLSRRTFVERMGVSTVAAAVLGTEAMADDKKGRALDDAALKHEEVTFDSGGQKVNAFLCRPDVGGKRGAVIVVHEIFGANDHIRDIACRLARAGYDGLAVDFFTREGKPPSMEGGFGPLMEFVGRIPDAQLMQDVRSAAAYLRSRPDSNGKVGIVGFCWGGRVSMLASAEVRDLNAAVAYYGRIRQPQKTANQPSGPIDLVERVHAPLLGHFGALDRSIPVEDVNALREGLQSHHKRAELYVYEGANHAFNNDTRESYNAEAAKQAWQRTQGWFEKYLK